MLGLGVGFMWLTINIGDDWSGSVCEDFQFSTRTLAERKLWLRARRPNWFFSSSFGRFVGCD